MKPTIVVLSSRSLYAEGVLSRLKHHAQELEIHTVDTSTPDMLDQLIEAAPTAVILDANDIDVNMQCPLGELFRVLPRVKVIRLDVQEQGFQVVTSERIQAQEVDDLVAVIRQPHEMDSN